MGRSWLDVELESNSRERLVSPAASNNGCESLHPFCEKPLMLIFFFSWGYGGSGKDTHVSNVPTAIEPVRSTSPTTRKVVEAA